VLNDPIGAVDPFGLKKLEIMMYSVIDRLSAAQVDDETGMIRQGAALGFRGAFFWPVDMLLRGKADPIKGGWIIQKIDATWTGDKHPVFDRKDFKVPYWEAFHVEPNASYADRYELPDEDYQALRKYGITFRNDTKFTDVYWLQSGRNATAGSVTISGEAFFLDCLSEQQLKDAGFSKKETAIGPGNLYFTTKLSEVNALVKEVGAGNVGPAKDHSIQVRWSKDDPYTKIVNQSGADPL
jgi:hypothetical protein